MTQKNEDFDIVITGGRVMDPETGLDAVRNIGVLGDKIARITEDEIQGRETIDARNHIVAPGFIDMHNHNAGVPFGEKAALRDGVTTPMELEAGVYPVSDWYERLEGKCRTNYGASVGTLPVREHVFNPEYTTQFAGDAVYDLMAAPEKAHTSMKWSTQVATAGELKRIEQYLEEGLKQGAIGIGHTPGYMVAGVTQEEAIICQKLVGKYKQSVYIHCRFSGQRPPASGILGFMEQMAPQLSYGGGIVFQHMTAQALADTPQALELFDAAREKGIPALAEVYPYDFGGTIVAADYLHPDNYGPNMGREYKDIIETATGTPLTRQRYEQLVKTAPGTNVLFYNATEDTVLAALAHPTSVLGSDAFPFVMKTDGSCVLDWEVPFEAVNGHPRAAGAHAKLLRWVREKKVNIPLMLAVSKMTYMIARYLQDNGVPQMADKGRLQEGKDADITIFDPENVQDNSTIENGGLPSTGIPHVLVNGTVVVRNSENVNNVFPGRPVFGSEKSDQ
jgi:cytosine/adenosine deaminase-related metal-dependent hydrolase